MPLESSITSISSLDASSPAGTEDEREGDDHLRNIKKAIRTLITAVPGAEAPKDVALVSTTLTPTSATINVLPVGAASSGTLTNIATSAVIDGGWVLVRAADAARPITVQHTTSGTGPIILKDAGTFVLNHSQRALLLHRRGNQFLEIERYFEGGRPVVGTSGAALGLLNANLTYSGTITHNGVVTFNADPSIKSTDAGSDEGPGLEVERASASPAVNDFLGYYRYTGRSSTGVERTYAKTRARIVDPTNASEDGLFLIGTIVGGTLDDRVFVGAGLYLKGATGDDPGEGKFNATDVLINNVSLKRAPFVHEVAAGAWSENSTPIEQAHGLGGYPDDYYLEAECTITEYGIPVGARIKLTNSAEGGPQGATVYVTPTLITAAIRSIRVVQDDNNSVSKITPANWKLRLTAEKRV